MSRVAIAGSGMVGSFLFKLLKQQGIQADLYGAENGHTACRIHPCAWGSSSCFYDHVKAVDLDPGAYVLVKPNRVNFEGVDLPANLLTFDKPRMIRDLQDGTKVINGPVKPGAYERVIDATGVRRGYLPPIRDDLVIPCIQYRMRYAKRDSSVVMIKYGNIGYSYSFPLSEHEFHIGGGSLTEDPKSMLPQSGLLGEGGAVVCGCSGRVRSSSPKMSQPFIVKSAATGCDVWGVGESIGVVAPIAGEGIAPGMMSARMLVKNWDSAEKYSKQILKEFAWMFDERRILEKLLSGGKLGMQDWRTLRKTGQRMGANLGLRDTMDLLKFLAK